MCMVSEGAITLTGTALDKFEYRYTTTDVSSSMMHQNIFLNLDNIAILLILASMVASNFSECYNVIDMIVPHLS